VKSLISVRHVAYMQDFHCFFHCLVFVSGIRYVLGKLGVLSLTCSLNLVLNVRPVCPAYSYCQDNLRIVIDIRVLSLGCIFHCCFPLFSINVLCYSFFCTILHLRYSRIIL
jgi:hypothetical protein